MNRIAIIAHDPDKRARLAGWVEELGHRAVPYNSGLLAEQALHRQNLSMVICDFKSRNIDGLALSRAAREGCEIPILILSESLDDVELVLALHAGADQALSWPASKSVTTVAIEALLDRYYRLLRNGEPDQRKVEAGHLSLDPEYHVARWRGRDVKLTANEFAILWKLAHRPGRVRSREQLMGAEGSMPAPERTIDSHIKRIRRKFRDVDPGFNQIVTLYGLGYRFNAEDQVDATPTVATVNRYEPPAGRVAYLSHAAASASRDQ